MQKRLFLFDLDWTVIYTGGAGIWALNHAFMQNHQIPEAMKGISPDGKTDPAIIREMIKVHLGRDPKARRRAKKPSCQSFTSSACHLKSLNPKRAIASMPAEFLRLLENLSKMPDVLLGLGTGNLEGGARAKAKLARADLMRYFKFGGYADDSENPARAARSRVSVSAAKPSPPEDSRSPRDR